jgi:hypothetical protein
MKSLSIRLVMKKVRVINLVAASLAVAGPSRGLTWLRNVVAFSLA